MKRLMPSTLITFLQNNPNCHKADCFVIQLPTGAVLCATEGQWDITFLTSTPGWTGAQTTFKAAQYGVWSRGKITSEASAKCGSNTMDLTCIPKPGTNYPGLGLGILNAALNHLFDGATVWVYTAYMPIGQYGNVSVGIETKFQGTISKAPVLSRSKVQFECADPMYLLNMKVPSRLMQSNCPWSFCDDNCTLSAADYTVPFAANSGSQSSLTPTVAFTQADGYFAQGVVKCLTGANAGLSQTVKAYAGGVINVMVPWLLPVHAGDTFAVIKGCDKTITTCKNTVKANGTVIDNSINNGSTPFPPAPSSAI
jgi:Phage conserved hypothetical protein BR0599/Uncharacterized conserved protein (DUF2163)